MTQTNEDDGLVSESIKDLFHKLMKENGIKVETVTIEPGSIKGDNYLGIIAKVVVKGKDKDGAPVDSSYIIKSAPKSEGLRKIAPIRLAYEREIYVYTNVLPEFNRFQTEHKIKNPFNSFADCLKMSCDEKDEALIMKDMKAMGYVMQNRKYALDYSHVKVVLTELARLHAVSFALKGEKPEVFKEFEKNMEKNYFKDMDMEGFEEHSMLQVEKAENSLKPETDQKAIEMFQLFKQKEHMDHFAEHLDDRGHPYSVIRHGDCWTNNVLFAYNDKENPEKPTGLCFLDWQLSSVGPPALDLLYFLYCCTDKKLRDEHFDQLLKDYYQTLKEFTAEFGHDIEKLYPFSVLLEQMKKHGYYGLAAAIMLLHLLTSDSEEIPDINTIFESGDSKNQIMEAFSFESKNIDMYNTRIRDVILHMIEKEFV